jgi:hypothetical protein
MSYIPSHGALRGSEGAKARRQSSQRASKENRRHNDSSQWLWVRWSNKGVACGYQAVILIWKRGERSMWALCEKCSERNILGQSRALGNLASPNLVLQRCTRRHRSALVMSVGREQGPSGRKDGGMYGVWVSWGQVRWWSVFWASSGKMGLPQKIQFKFGLWYIYTWKCHNERLCKRPCVAILNKQKCHFFFFNKNRE